MSESIKKLTEAYNTLYTSQELTESELTALERSAFVAGGGEAAKAKKNQTVAQIIAQGKLNLTKPGTPAAATLPPAPVLPPPQTAPTTTTPPTAPIPTNTSSATASTADKIKGGMDVYNKQIAAKDMKGATETGKNISALKYGSPEERKAKTVGTRNPLMDKTFGYQTGNSPTDQQARADKIVASGAVSALAKAGGVGAVGTTPPIKPAMSKVKESRNIIRGYLMREGYTK